MSLLSLVDQYRLFAAYKHIFSGSKSRYRKMKKVQVEVERSEHHASFQELVKDYGIGKIVATIHTLLARGVFSSDLEARVLFSEFYFTSTATDIIQVDSAANIVSSGLIASEHAKTDRASRREQHASQKQDFCLMRQSAKRKLRSQSESTSFRSAELPFRTQHFILTPLQRILEECCFDFALKWAPWILEKNHWDCAEAVELNKITAALICVCEQLPDEAVLPSFVISFKQILRAADDIRHSAVHRIQQRVQAVERMIENACQLAQTLQDQERLHTLQRLQRAVSQNILQRKIEKSKLCQRFNQEREEIMLLRQQLDRREETAFASMVKQDEKDKVSTALMLEIATTSIFASAAESNPAVKAQILCISKASEGSYTGTLSEKDDLESIQTLNMNKKLEIPDGDSNSRTLKDDIGDDDVSDKKWDTIFAAVGLIEPRSEIIPSSQMARTSYARTPNSTSASTAYHSTEVQHYINELKHETAGTPNNPHPTPLYADTNTPYGQVACSTDNQDITLASPIAGNTNMEKRVTTPIGSEENGYFERRAASDGEEVERFNRCKRRRLWA